MTALRVSDDESYVVRNVATGSTGVTSTSAFPIKAAARRAFFANADVYTKAASRAANPDLITYDARSVLDLRPE